MEKTKKIPPLWWSKVISDLEKAVLAAKQSYYDRNVVLAKTEKHGETLGFYIRLESKKVGYFPIKSLERTPPLGSILHQTLPEPESIVEEPNMVSYAYGVIGDNIGLVPKQWLHSVITKIVGGEPITMKNDLKPFPVWIAISIDKKEDKALIDLLYRAARYEGLKGLARFNDLAPN